MDATITETKSYVQQFDEGDYVTIPALMQANKISDSCLLSCIKHAKSMSELKIR